MPFDLSCMILSYGPLVWSFGMVLYFFFWTGSCLRFFHNLLPLFSCSCDAINSDSRTQDSVDSFLLVLLLGNWKVHVKRSSPAGTLNVSRFNSFRFSPILMLSFFWICGATNPDSSTRDSVDLSCMVLWYDPLVWSFGMVLRYGPWSFSAVCMCFVNDCYSTARLVLVCPLHIPVTVTL